MKNGRFFNDYTEDAVRELFAAENGWESLNIFITGGVRDGRGEERWVNGVVKRLRT